VSAARVLVARRLLPAGLDRLESRYEVVEGGLDSGPEQWLRLAPGSAALVADASVAVDEALIEACGAGLRVVANFAVGYDNVDLDACARRGVMVTNTPDVLTNATAELALALTLAAARRLSDAERQLRAGEWRGWDPAAHRGLELSGSVVGVVGMGRIGTRYAELLRGFEADLLYAGPRPKPEAEERLGAVRVELPKLLRRADAVSLHAPATAATRHLIDAEAIALMRPDAVLVNAARGALVDSLALAAALREGRLGAAGLDVYEGEPDVPRELLEAPRVVLAPHIGSATVKARDAMAAAVAENVIAVLEGRDPPNPVELDRQE
jgi:glyoxylate reductase